MITANQLEQFALNIKEARIYLAALELGQTSVQRIAQKAGIHRVTTYDIVENLKQKGLIAEVPQGAKKLLLATNPEYILNDLESKKMEFTKLLPELKALESKTKYRPKVMYFEGKKEVLQAYFDRIHYPEVKENLVYGSSKLMQQNFGEQYKKFTHERVAKKIKARIIVERSKASQIQALKSQEEIREVKFLPNNIQFKTNTIIYGNRVMNISWEGMWLTIIEDESYAQNQRTIFRLLWNYLP